MIKSIFTGHLGADAETFETGKGQFVSFRVATNDYDTKAQQEVTTWVKVTASQSLVGNKKLLKGSHVFVTGNLKASTYQTKNGETAISLDVFADSISYVGGKGSGATETTAVTTEQTVSTGTLKKPVVAETTVAKEPEDDLPF
jgi:single-stranded DNA-binding protein